MSKSVDIDTYNRFCSNLKEGYVLYNVDSTNLWGDYLLVVDIIPVRIGNNKTYTVLLLGLKKENGVFKTRNLRIKLTPDHAKNIPFLKYVGHCNFDLQIEMSNVNINTGLVTVYGQTDLHKFATNLSIRKPRKNKYGKDGKLIIKPTSNK